MEFDIKDWRKIYDEVQRIAKMLQDSNPTYGEDKKLISAVHPLTIESKIDLNARIKKLLIKNTHYLDACDIKPHEPLWSYNIDDRKTWPSDKSFIYGHLLNKTCKVRLKYE